MMENLCQNASFITTADPRSSVSPVFRRTFAVTKAVKTATLSVTAQGIYEALLNAVRVGDFLFAPGFTSYAKRLQVQTYDVTAQIREGENVLDILVGNGWHFGGLQRGAFENLGVRAVIASLVLTYADGTTEEIVTDRTWKTSKTQILSSDLYNGETYDANVVYGNWEDAIETEGKRDTLIPQEGEIVRAMETLPAVSLIRTPRGECVIDFGQEVTGFVTFRTVGDIGERIVLDHAEMLDKDGNFYTANYRAAKSRVTYITDGNTGNWFHPHFSFQGFRYIRLTEYPTTDIYLGDFRAVVVHSDMKRIGQFTCSDQLVNRLYENVIWGQRGNFLDIPTDCPQRDERLGWTGDAQVFCRTAAYNYDVKKFFHKWLHDLAADQGANGGVPEIIPRLWGDGSHGSFAWADAATVCPWEIYRAYGDRSILEEQIDSMKGWVDFLKNKGDTPEDWNRGGQFGDWLGLDAEEGSYRGATSDPLLATAFVVYSTDLLVKAGNVLGRDMREYAAYAAFVRDVFQKHFIGEDGMLTCDTQTAYVVALAFDLVPEKARYAAHLAEKIHANGDKLQTGFIGTAYIMDALTQNGYADVAYTLLLQKEFPSWLYCVRKGATTIWEHWDGLKPDGSMWSEAMNSFNHYAYGAVAAWLYGTVAGINPDESRPGYDHILIKPIPDARLSHASAALETRHGTVSSGWKKTEDGYILSVTIPEGATADVTFGGETHFVGAGSYTYISKE